MEHNFIFTIDQAEISLLTGSPFNEEVFTPYGHTSIRVVDPENGMDWLFNYGIFNFEKDFIYRFTKGNADYKLMAYKTGSYITEAVMKGIEVTEQVLNLNQEEKQAFWNALVENAQPENALYRYNFFYDNCSTRPAELIERVVQGKVEYNFPEMHFSFRDLINNCTRGLPWQTFGCDLVLGSPTDKEITPRETFFLPVYLKDGLAAAKIIAPDGTARPVILKTNILAEKDREEPSPGFFTPIVCFTLLFLLVILLTYWERKKKKYYRWLDILLFSVAGIAGCVVFFLCFISTQPCTWPNWNVIWLHPFHLIAVVLFMVKKMNKVTICYHFINFVALTLFMLAWSLLPQHMNMAALFLILCLWCRSGMAIYRWKSKNK